jgi:hypothetical protein
MEDATVFNTDPAARPTRVRASNGCIVWTNGAFAGKSANIGVKSIRSAILPINWAAASGI